MNCLLIYRIILLKLLIIPLVKLYVIFFRTNATFAQLEIRDSNSAVVKRITFDNSSNEAIAPTLKLVSREGNKEIRQDIKPHEIRHLFIPRVLYQENKSRAGFLNNRRKEQSNKTIAVETTTGSAVVYIAPEKLEGLDKEVEVDPEEEFQVDESNHGLYLLNYSDTDNVTQNHPDFNKVASSNEVKDDTKYNTETTTISSVEEKDKPTTVSDKLGKEEKLETNVIANSTEIHSTRVEKLESDKEKGNQTLFMSEEIYNHFRPLETELPDEEMAPFIFFGQKLGGQGINDNLTNSPSLSASTKSVNFIAAPLEKRKFNSRYSATEKYKNNSAGEEEINEDMDVSVVKNTIEKNKIRNTVKGPAPARHVGLVNAYRKYSSTTQSTLKPEPLPLMNETESSTQNATLLDKTKENSPVNGTSLAKDPIINVNSNFTKDIPTNRTNIATPKNYTRVYSNLRRRPSRLNTMSSTENVLSEITNTTTTEKASTSVYTAVVTSVSITSSIKGQNKTDSLVRESDNNTVTESNEEIKNVTIPKVILINDTEITPSAATTLVPLRHRIRIRTTTTKGPLSSIPTSTPAVLTQKPLEAENSERSVQDIKPEMTTSRVSDGLATLFRPNDYENTTTAVTLKPRNKVRRRRPTTTTTTTSTTTVSTTTFASLTTTPKETETTSPATFLTTIPTTQTVDPTENVLKPLVVTSRTSSKSSSKPLILTLQNSSEPNPTALDNKTNLIDRDDSQNEEVVIEAEKTYTASYVLAGLGFLPVIAVVAFVLRNLLNKKIKEIDTEYEGYFEEGGDIKKESPITPVARPPLPTPSKPDQKWEFPRNKLRLQTLLGQGNFGQVKF